MPPRQHTFSIPHQTDDGSEVQWQYRATLMPPMRAHDLLRRVTPAIAGRIASTVANRDHGSIRAEVIGQVIAAFSDIKKDDHDHVISSLLSGVQVKTSASAPWADVWNAAAPFDKGLMFDDMGLHEMYQILKEVVEFTYGNFISILSRMSSDGEAAA